MRQDIVKDVLVGRNDRGEKYHLSVELVSDERERESVSHEKIKGFQWLSFHGLGVSPRGSIEYERGIFSAGQNYEMLLKITQPAKGFTLESIREIYELWQEWHLNDMKSHCVHQDEAVAWDKVAPCPLTGYKAGSAWLSKPLLDGVIEQISALVKRERVGA